MQNNMPTDWNNLIREIERGNCALVLGHGLLTGADGEAHYTEQCQRLAKENADLIDAFYAEEHFFLFKAARHRRKFANQIEESYRELRPDMGLYRMLAEIPVPLYVSVSPDDFLDRALGENGQSGFFNHADTRAADFEADRANPLVYHIFGSVKDTNSLVLSHDNLFDYFKSMLGAKGLPTALKKFFKEDAGGEVVFLGFDFRRWYVQLLLRLFNLSRNDNELNRTAYSEKEAPDNVEAAKKHFHVEFVDSDTTAFVRTLHQKCAERGILRTLSDSRQAAQETLLADRKKRVEDIKALLIANSKLRAEWEEKELLAENPTERMRCRLEIDKLGAQIEELRAELKSLAQ